MKFLVGIFPYQNSLRIFAVCTEHKFTDETIEEVLQFAGIMLPIYDVTLIFQIKVGLGAEFTAKIFGWI